MNTQAQAAVRKPAKILESITEERLSKLEHKLGFLWAMVVFLKENPGYKINDYLIERNAQLVNITKEG